MNYDDPNWTQEFTLIPHPDFPPPLGVTFTARAGRDSGVLHLHFSQFGDEDEELILILPPGNGGKTDNLWQHTCFEAFVRAEGEGSYAEFNFSNWGDWAAYRFDDRRKGMRELVGASDTAGLSYKGDGGDGIYHRLYVTIDALDPSRDWDIGLSIVVEAKDGTKSYWALAHCDGPPDFHNPDTFIARLPVPSD